MLRLSASIAGSGWKKTKAFHSKNESLNHGEEIKEERKDHPSEYSAADYFAEGISCYENDNNEKALELFSKAIELNPRYAEVYIYRGHIHTFKKEFEKAISDYSQAINCNNDAEAYNYRGNLYADRGQFKQAISDFEDAIKLKPDFSDAYNNLAITYYNNKDYEASKKMY